MPYGRRFLAGTVEQWNLGNDITVCRQREVCPEFGRQTRECHRTIVATAVLPEIAEIFAHPLLQFIGNTVETHESLDLLACLLMLDLRGIEYSALVQSQYRHRLKHCSLNICSEFTVHISGDTGSSGPGKGDMRPW
jgi:hypothetical protein